MTEQAISAFQKTLRGRVIGPHDTDYDAARSAIPFPAMQALFDPFFPKGLQRYRLASVKAKYDPRNLFRVNQNIAPAAA